MNKKHTMPSRLIELEHELSAALIKVDDQRELLRLAKEENEEKRKDIVWTMGERAKLMDRIKQLEEALTEIELAMKQPASNHRLMQISGPARQVINIIKKAKEAKP